MPDMGFTIKKNGEYTSIGLAIVTEVSAILSSNQPAETMLATLNAKGAEVRAQYSIIERALIFAALHKAIDMMAQAIDG